MSHPNTPNNPHINKDTTKKTKIIKHPSTQNNTTKTETKAESPTATPKLTWYKGEKGEGKYIKMVNVESVDKTVESSIQNAQRYSDGHAYLFLLCHLQRHVHILNFVDCLSSSVRVSTSLSTAIVKIFLSHYTTVF